MQNLCILHLQSMSVFKSTKYGKQVIQAVTQMDWVKYCCLLLCMCFVYSRSLAQSAKSNRFRFVDIKLHRGGNYYSGENFEEALQNGYGALEIRYGWHTKGDHEWEGA